MKKIILSTASLIVTGTSVILVKANAKLHNHAKVFGLTAAGVCCTLCTGETDPHGQKGAICQTVNGQFTVTQGPNGTLWKAKTFTHHCKCTKPTLKWTGTH